MASGGHKKKDDKNNATNASKTIQNLQLLMAMQQQPVHQQPGTSTAQMYDPSLLAGAGGLWSQPSSSSATAADVQQLLALQSAAAVGFPMGINSAANNPAAAAGFPALGTLSGFQHGMLPVGSNEWIAMQAMFGIPSNPFYPPLLNCLDPASQGAANQQQQQQQQQQQSNKMSDKSSSSSIKESTKSSSSNTRVAASGKHYNDSRATSSGKSRHVSGSSGGRKSEKLETMTMARMNQRDVVHGSMQNSEKITEWMRQMEQQQFFLQKLQQEAVAAQSASGKDKAAKQQQQKDMLQQQLLNAAAAAATGLHPAAFMPGAAINPLLANMMPFASWGFPEMEAHLNNAKNHANRSMTSQSPNTSHHKQQQRMTRPHNSTPSPSHKSSSRTSNGGSSSDQQQQLRNNHRAACNSQAARPSPARTPESSSNGSKKRHHNDVTPTMSYPDQKYFNDLQMIHQLEAAAVMAESLKSLQASGMSGGQQFQTPTNKSTHQSGGANNSSSSGSRSHSTGTFHPPTWTPSLSPQVTGTMDGMNKHQQQQSNSSGGGRRRKQAAPTSLSGNVGKPTAGSTPTRTLPTTPATNNNKTEDVKPPSASALELLERELKARIEHELNKTNSNKNKSTGADPSQMIMGVPPQQQGMDAETAKMMMVAISSIKSMMTPQQQQQQQQTDQPPIDLEKLFLAMTGCPDDAAANQQSSSSDADKSGGEFQKWRLNHTDHSRVPQVDTSHSNNGLVTTGEKSEKSTNYTASTAAEPAKSVEEKNCEEQQQGDTAAGDNNNSNHQRYLNEEDRILEPIKHGWIREIHIDEKTTHDSQGQVFYRTPKKIKLKNQQELNEYLLTHKSFDPKHFSFDPELPIGNLHFSDKVILWETLRELTNPNKEIIKPIDNQLEAGMNFARGNSVSQSNHNNTKSPTVMTCGINDVTMINHIDQKDEGSQELRLQKENREKFFKQQKLEQQKLEQQQLFKQLREQQLLEERQRMEIARQIKQQETIKKAKEKEDRRQHLLNLKALENQRRAEERDRRKEQIRMERIQQRERKLEQKRQAMKLAQKNKITFEDRQLKDLQPLPIIRPFQGTLQEAKKVELSGAATADLFMVLEFSQTFKEALGLEESCVIPTFAELRLGMLNNPGYVKHMVELTMALLHQCLCDPGVPVPGPWLNCAMGLKVTDIDINKTNYSEILRLFLWARNGQKTEISKQLETRPFPGLDTNAKASTLAFLVNELISSRPVIDEIDRHLEALASLRRDKWIVEGKIRQARIEAATEGGENCNSPSKIKKPKLCEPNETPQNNGEIVNGTDSRQARMTDVTKQKLENLSKEHQSFTSKLFVRSKPLRSLDCGQDRYKRRYWVLSHTGGVYVEGLESGLLPYDEEDVADLKSDGEEEDHKPKEETETAEAPTSLEWDDRTELMMLIPNADDDEDDDNKDYGNHLPFNDVESKNNSEEVETQSEKLEENPTTLDVKDIPTCNNQNIIESIEKSLVKIKDNEIDKMEVKSEVNGSDCIVEDQQEVENVSVRSFSNDEDQIKKEVKEETVTNDDSVEATTLKEEEVSCLPTPNSPEQDPTKMLAEETVLDTCDITTTSHNEENTTSLSTSLPAADMMKNGSSPDNQEIAMDLSTSLNKSQEIIDPDRKSAENNFIDSNCDAMSTTRDTRTPESSGTTADLNPYNHFHHQYNPHPQQQARMMMSTPVDLTPNDSDEADKLLDKPTDMPRELKYGWWKIDSEQELDNVMNALHPRGSREKELHRLVTKHKKHVVEAIDGNTDSVKVKVEKGEGEKKTGKQENEKKRKSAKKETSSEHFEDLDRTAFNSEMDVLKQVEGLLDRCIASNILNKAWSSIPKASVTRKDFRLTSHLDALKRETASTTAQMPHDDKSILGEAVHLIQKLEQAIPRAYLKPPLIRKGGATEFSNLPSLSESGAGDVAAGLRTWRNGVGSASSAAQLSMAVNMLQFCISWGRFAENRVPTRQRTDQSPKSKKKRSGEKRPNQHQNKKRKKTVAAVAAAPTDDTAVSTPASTSVDHQSNSRMPIENADVTTRKSTPAFNTQSSCEEKSEQVEDNKETIPGSPTAPPSETTATTVTASSNNNNNSKPKKKKKPKPPPPPAMTGGDEQLQTPKPKKKKTHTSVCRDVLRDLQAHEQSVYFLYPVNVKEIPDYKKIIKKPIDFQTIEKRLRKGRYKNRHSFSAEVRMVFDNCQAYNMDESPIGRAGHNIREYFEEKWAEVEERAEEEDKLRGDDEGDVEDSDQVKLLDDSEET